MNWQHKKIKISELKEYEHNPRSLTAKGLDDLEKSIKKFGVAEPLVLNADYTICGGHGRLKILQRLGIKEVDCYLPERKLTKKEFEELNIRLNKNIAGTWDYDILANNFELPDLLNWGFEEDELCGYFGDELEEDEIPEVPKETKIKAGDKFQLGEHFLICGDSTDPAVVNELFLHGKPDIVFTDPPYDMDYNLIEKCFENIQGVGGVQFWMGADKQLIKLAAKFDKEFTHFFVHDYINATMISGSQPMQQHNLIAKFRNKKMKNHRDGFSTILKVQTNRIKKEHDLFNMGKNIELPGAFIKHYCDSCVLDLFGGYGSTLMAAEQLNKQCLMIELNPYYCDLIIQRWEKQTNKKASLTIS
jgi:DNA modification methylase